MAYTYPLNTPEALAQAKSGVEQALLANQVADADEFCLFYEIFLRENPTFALEQPDFAKEYDALYRKAQWVALPVLKDDKDVMDMFRTRLAVLKQMPDFDLTLALRDHLLSFDVGARNEYKARIRDALTQNKETATPPFAAVANKLERQGTIGNWVTEYLSFMGSDVDEPLLQARFWTESDFARQSAEDKAFLRRLFTVLEMTRKSSEEMAGYEGGRLVEGDGRLGEFSEGDIRDLGADEDLNRFTDALSKDVAQQTAERMKQAYVDTPAYAATLREALGKISDVAKDPPRLRQALVTALTGGKKAPPREQVVAALRAYAAVGDMAELFSVRELSDVVRAYLEKEKRTVDLDTFKVFPGSPQFVKLFLQVLLQETLKLPEAEAAREALQVANILRRRGDESLMDVAVFDEVLGSFAWKSPLRRAAA